MTEVAATDTALLVGVSPHAAVAVAALDRARLAGTPVTRTCVSAWASVSGFGGQPRTQSQYGLLLCVELRHRESYRGQGPADQGVEKGAE